MNIGKVKAWQRDFRICRELCESLESRIADSYGEGMRDDRELLLDPLLKDLSECSKRLIDSVIRCDDYARS